MMGYRKRQKFRSTKLPRFLWIFNKMRKFSLRLWHFLHEYTGSWLVSKANRKSFPDILIKSSEPRKFCTVKLLSFMVFDKNWLSYWTWVSENTICQFSTIAPYMLEGVVGEYIDRYIMP